MTPPIAIIGAGPSGLTFGRLLEVAGIDYIIFDRDESSNAKSQGGSLDIHTGSGQLALQEAGLLDQFKKAARFEGLKTTLANDQGEVLVSFGGDGDGSEECRPEIDRKELRALLLNSVPPNKVRWASKVRDVQRDTDGTTSIRFADGNEVIGFKLVVGADGAWSKVRSLITSATPVYSGLYYLATTIGTANPFHGSVASLVGPGAYMAMGSEKSITAQGNGDGSYTIYAGLRLPEGWSAGDSLPTHSSHLRQSLLHNHFVGWAPVNTDLIKHSDGEIRPWPLYAMPPESLSWTTVPGVTLIGDAAHVSTPFVGEGVNCAMTDSIQLAQQIVKYGMDDLDRAVAEYEKLMFPRGIDLITRSAISGKLLFAPDAPREFLEIFMPKEPKEE